MAVRSKALVVRGLWGVTALLPFDFVHNDNRSVGHLERWRTRKMILTPWLMPGCTPDDQPRDDHEPDSIPVLGIAMGPTVAFTASHPLFLAPLPAILHPFPVRSEEDAQLSADL